MGRGDLRRRRAQGLRAYIEREQPHLLRVYDADFLVNAIESISARADGLSRMRSPDKP